MRHNHVIYIKNNTHLETSHKTIVVYNRNLSMINFCGFVLIRRHLTLFAYQFYCLTFIRSLTYDIYSVSILLIVSHHRNISFVDHCLFFGSFSFGRCMGPSWSWSYGSWIYNYMCNQCMSPLKLWARIPLMVRSTRYNIMW